MPLLLGLLLLATVVLLLKWYAEADIKTLKSSLRWVGVVLGLAAVAVLAVKGLLPEAGAFLIGLVVWAWRAFNVVQMLRAMGQNQLPSMKPTLEINPDHEIVKKLLGSSDEALINDAAWLLLEQALLIEGLPVENPGMFVQRLNRVLSRAV